MHRGRPRPGATPHTTIRALVDWTEEHQNEISTARAAYDVREAAEHAALEEETARRDRSLPAHDRNVIAP